jgi:hypothetical protein
MGNDSGEGNTSFLFPFRLLYYRKYNITVKKVREWDIWIGSHRTFAHFGVDARTSDGTVCSLHIGKSSKRTRGSAQLRQDIFPWCSFSESSKDLDGNRLKCDTLSLPSI